MTPVFEILLEILRNERQGHLHCIVHNMAVGDRVMLGARTTVAMVTFVIFFSRNIPVSAPEGFKLSLATNNETMSFIYASTAWGRVVTICPGGEQGTSPWWQ